MLIFTENKDPQKRCYKFIMKNSSFQYNEDLAYIIEDLAYIISQFQE